MIQENEAVLLIVAVGVLAFFFLDRERIQALPERRLFTLAFAVLTAGWTFTVLEGLIWPDTLNLLEHICYALSSSLLAVWCWRVFTDNTEPSNE